MRFGARAPHSLDATRKVLGRLLETPSGLQAQTMNSRSTQNHSMDIFRSTQRLWDSTMKSSGLVRPGAAGLLTGMEYSGVGNSTWIRPTSSVTTRTVVEQVEYKETTRPTRSRTLPMLGWNFPCNPVPSDYIRVDRDPSKTSNNT